MGDWQLTVVLAGQTLPIALTGKDVSDGALSFVVVGAPIYGTLSGRAPTLEIALCNTWLFLKR